VIREAGAIILIIRHGVEEGRWVVVIWRGVAGCGGVERGGGIPKVLEGSRSGLNLDS
jgi:hypothetical protein